MSNIHQMKRYAIVGTPTPTDGWSSYFDSWTTEDSQVPTFEPLIVDDELHPDVSNIRFNLDMDMEVDWDMDMQSPYVSALQSNGKAKLNGGHPDYQRHGSQRNDVAGWERPWLGRAHDDGGRPLHRGKVQIGAGEKASGVEGAPGWVRGTGMGMGVRTGSDVLPRVPPVPPLGVRRAFKVKVSLVFQSFLPAHLHHHVLASLSTPPFASSFPVHAITARLPLTVSLVMATRCGPSRPALQPATLYLQPPRPTTPRSFFWFPGFRQLQA
ncbi:uncharacterized protein A1O9_06763 [Exophiala aquamarina CBS 119918]|uniref:Uncharacterized protein n=1 Tax=Exophiala aquamarina CBS 119918 TaxID=1182545 RepID=A0A072P8X3_9EURO|nr:uncharacterized protein A1O9_06763 [Exophiala aquamarina CBS 119918]KEF56574.1 hypothetical protein A1O9_06763 [Exophiala aquamarina CBS 119918]